MIPIKNKKAKAYVIQFAKVFPFVLCFAILISYVDCLHALINKNYLIYEDSIILDTPLNFAIARFYEYGIYILVCCLVLSYAMETCIWNRLCVVYEFCHLVEKYSFSNIELYEEVVCIVVSVNILVALFLCYKGFFILIKQK